jgi:hypothetical protein
MQPIVIKATDLRVRTRDIMLGVKFKYERYVVESFGKPMAIILNPEEYERLIADKVSPIETPVDE